MQDELRQKKILFYSIAYFTNLNFLIVLLLMSTFLEYDYDHNPYYSILIWIIPAFISVVISMFIIRNNIENNLPREKGIIKLALAHSPSLIGLFAALFYLFVY